MALTHDQIRSALASGCAEEEFAKMRCPVCDAELELDVHPDRHTFFVYCKADTKHLAMHDEGETAPSWFNDRVTPGRWY